jgi:hypothetical protein
MKAGDLKELTGLMTQKTGAKIEVNPLQADWKLSVFINQVPARDLMRQIVRLFDLECRRTGEEGKYEYQFTQSLKQRLDEEERIRRDRDEILLDIDGEMGSYSQYLDANPATFSDLASEAKANAETAGSVEWRRKFQERQRMFEILSHPLGLDALKVFSSLTPDQMVALRNDGRVEIPYDGSGGIMTRQMVLDVQKSFSSDSSDFHGYKAADLPFDKIDASAYVSMDNSRPDQSELTVTFGFGNKDGGFHPGFPVALTTGEPKALQSDAILGRKVQLTDPKLADRKVSFDPKADHPLEVKEDTPEWQRLMSLSFTFRNNLNNVSSEPNPGQPSEWIDSADALEEIHRKTGLNIVSDYYLRVYPRQWFVQDGKLPDALNNDASVLKSEWTADGDFLRLRRMNYYAERALDAPNRLLRRWSADRQRDGYLNLDDMAEIAQLPKSVLWDDDFQRAVLLKWGLMELQAVQYGQSYLNFYASLSPDQKLQIQSDAGLSLASLSSAQSNLLNPSANAGGDQANGRIFMRLRQPGWYIWRPLSGEGYYMSDAPMFPGKEPIREKEKSAAQAKAVQFVKAHPLPWSANWPSPETLVQGPGAGIWICIPKDGSYVNFDYWYDRP